jgi:hypothetical protein
MGGRSSAGEFLTASCRAGMPDLRLVFLESALMARQGEVDNITNDLEMELLIKSSFELE